MRLKSASIKDERYSPSDFLNDLPRLRSLVEGVKSIASDLNVYFYGLSNE